MNINLVKNVINGVNLIKVGHFGENGQIGPFWGPKLCHSSKFEESGQKILSLVYKNYFSKVVGHTFGQKCHLWGQFGQNRSFLVKMRQIGTFLDQKLKP